MSTTYSPSLVANAFLMKAGQSGVQITHMKLQKLVFFLHAWALALHGGTPLAERPEAWPYGPVFDSLYHELKGFGSGPINQYLLQMDPNTGERKPMIPQYEDNVFWVLLGQVWERYKDLSAMQLSTLTHEPGGPWDIARKENHGWLKDDIVRNYYGAQLSAQQPQATQF